MYDALYLWWFYADGRRTAQALVTQQSSVPTCSSIMHLQHLQALRSVERGGEAKLAVGASVLQVAKELGISEASFHRWRKRYGSMQMDSMKRLKDLET